MAIDAGSRYEVGYPFGTSHFLEKLAFAVSNFNHDLVDEDYDASDSQIELVHSFLSTGPFSFTKMYFV